MDCLKLLIECGLFVCSSLNLDLAAALQHRMDLVVNKGNSRHMGSLMVGMGEARVLLDCEWDDDFDCFDRYWFI